MKATLLVLLVVCAVAVAQPTYPPCNWVSLGGCAMTQCNAFAGSGVSDNVNNINPAGYIYCNAPSGSGGVYTLSSTPNPAGFFNISTSPGPCNKYGFPASCAAACDDSANSVGYGWFNYGLPDMYFGCGGTSPPPVSPPTPIASPPPVAPPPTPVAAPKHHTLW